MTTKAYELAILEIGTVEWEKGDNPKVVNYFWDAGHKEVQTDATAWCAAFVGAMLTRAGMKGTGKLNARSYLDWGVPVERKDAQEGDIVILKRGKSTWEGHVAFLVKDNGVTLTLLGGNQSNAVNRRAYKITKENLLGIRRAVSATTPKGRTNVAQSTTVQASAVQLASGLGGGVAAVGALDGTAQIVAIIVCAVVVVAAAWVMRERIKKWANGIR